MWILTLDIHDVKLSLWRRTGMALLLLVLRYLVLPWQTSSKGEFRSDKACLDTIFWCSFYDACVCVSGFPIDSVFSTSSPYCFYNFCFLQY